MDWETVNLVVAVKDSTQKKVVVQIRKRFHLVKGVTSNWYWVVLPNNEGILKTDHGWVKEASGNMLQLFATGEATWLLQLQDVFNISIELGVVGNFHSGAVKKGGPGVASPLVGDLAPGLVTWTKVAGG